MGELEIDPCLREQSEEPMGELNSAIGVRCARAKDKDTRALTLSKAAWVRVESTLRLVAHLFHKPPRHASDPTD